MNQTILTEAIQPRIDGIEKDLVLLERFSALSLADFQKPEILDRVHHHLRMALEGVFNISSHILSRVPGSRETEYKKMARKMGEIGIVSVDFAESKLVAMGGYRNRLTNFYADVKADELYSIVRNNLVDFSEFLLAIKSVMRDPEQFGVKVA